MLRPAIEYDNVVYKYMTTISKVNPKDWRIYMNMLQESEKGWFFTLCN